MKKYCILVICMCMALTILFTSCTDSNDVNSDQGVTSESNTDGEVTLGTYIGVEVEVEEAVVTDDDVQNAVIDNIIAEQESVEITNRAVRNGDTANIDYSGSVNGEKFDGGTAEGHDLVIGSGSFIDGFEDQVIGMKIGETADINVTFPDPYTQNTALSGAKAVFTVTVNSITGKEIPDEITDAMIGKISDTYSTVEDYSKYIRTELEAEAEQTNNTNAQNAVWSTVINSSTVSSLPEAKVQFYYNLSLSDYEYYAESYGVELAEFIQSYVGTTEEQFYKDLQTNAEKVTTEQLIAEAIAKEQDISIKDDEYQSYVEENSITSENEEKYRDAIKDNLLYMKVIEFVSSKAKITWI